MSFSIKSTWYILTVEKVKALFAYISDPRRSSYFVPLTIEGFSSHIIKQMAPINIGVITDNAPKTCEAEYEIASGISNGTVIVRLEMTFDMARAERGMAETKITDAISAVIETEEEKKKTKARIFSTSELLQRLESKEEHSPESL